jgi:hypothetical protein
MFCNAFQFVKTFQKCENEICAYQTHISDESKHQGQHEKVVKLHFMIDMILGILPATEKIGAMEIREIESRQDIKW